MPKQWHGWLKPLWWPWPWGKCWRGMREWTRRCGPQSSWMASFIERRQMRGKHGNHAKGENHYRWRGGAPEPDPELRRRNARASAARYPDRRRAREKVKDAVRRGDLAPVKTLKCDDCGGSAQSYDHWLGYNQPLAVQPVCFKCHGKRSAARGEHKLNGRVRKMPALKSAGAMLDGREWREFPA